ncbi:MAG: hypothetical protein ABUL62_19305 [Myxococcales bacterium]
MLRPARPDLQSRLREGEQFRASLNRGFEQRARARAACQARIEQARASVFATGDGVVPSLMTDLEREWRTLSRFDLDDGMMDVWARLAPRSWLDRKRWRHSEPAARLDAAIALASDVQGVEAAEAAAGELRAALAAWGVTMGALVRWRAFDSDGDPSTELLTHPLQAARDALVERSARPLERAQQLEHAVLDAANARFPERPLLAQSLAHAALVDYSVQAAALDRPNPVTALRALWLTGYTLSAVDSFGVTLEIPPLALA